MANFETPRLYRLFLLIILVVVGSISKYEVNFKGQTYQVLVIPSVFALISQNKL